MTSNCLAWQGWRLDLPPRWNPVRIEGDYEQGFLLVADLHRPRLGLRWKRVPPKKDQRDCVRRALLDEVGQLAADEAQPHDMGEAWVASTLYVEPEPPGRDVWVACSRASGRCVQIIHHAHRRESLLAGTILPGLHEADREGPLPWSVFDLSCESPAGMKLVSHGLNAGDLSLTFQNHRQSLTIRQIALAELALKRMRLEKWLDDQQQLRRKHYRPIGSASEINLSQGRLTGLSKKMVRRRRFFFMRSLPPEMITTALHDEQRDRLVIVETSDHAWIESAALTVGRCS